MSYKKIKYNWNPLGHFHFKIFNANFLNISGNKELCCMEPLGQFKRQRKWKVGRNKLFFFFNSKDWLIPYVFGKTDEQNNSVLLSNIQWNLNKLSRLLFYIILNLNAQRNKSKIAYKFQRIYLHLLIIIIY